MGWPTYDSQVAYGYHHSQIELTSYLYKQNLLTIVLSFNIFGNHL